MFYKYLNKFGKAETEWVQEVLDMHSGNEPQAKAAVLAALDRVIARGGGHWGELTPFERSVEACCVANRMWWPDGLDGLKKLGRLPTSAIGAPQP